MRPPHRHALRRFLGLSTSFPRSTAAWYAGPGDHCQQRLEGLRERRGLPARARQGWRRRVPFFGGNDRHRVLDLDVGGLSRAGPGRRTKTTGIPSSMRAMGPCFISAAGMPWRGGRFPSTSARSMATGQWRPRPRTTSSPGDHGQAILECGLHGDTRAIRVGICSSSARTSCNAWAVPTATHPRRDQRQNRTCPKKALVEATPISGRRAIPRHRFAGNGGTHHIHHTKERTRSRASTNPPRCPRFLQIGSRKSPRCLLPPPVWYESLVCRFCRDTTPMFNQLSPSLAVQCRSLPNSTTRRACTSCRVIGQATQDHFARRRSAVPTANARGPRAARRSLCA